MTPLIIAAVIGVLVASMVYWAASWLRIDELAAGVCPICGADHRCDAEPEPPQMAEPPARLH